MNCKRTMHMRIVVILMMFTEDKNAMKINVGVFLNSLRKHIATDIKFPIIAIKQKTMENIAVTKHIFLFKNLKKKRIYYYLYKETL